MRRNEQTQLPRCAPPASAILAGMPRRTRVAFYSTLLALTFAFAACGEPPDKELHQAQGAIDAARAAGAAIYAPDELKAAVDALAHARDAVGERDYRLALNNALDSRERAQNAAKMAADQKAAARSDAERMLSEVTSALTVAKARLDAAVASHQGKALAPSTETVVSSARSAADDAGKLLATQDYLGAKARLEGVAASLTAVSQELAGVEPVSAAHPPHKPR